MKLSLSLCKMEDFVPQSSTYTWTMCDKNEQNQVKEENLLMKKPPA